MTATHTTPTSAVADDRTVPDPATPDPLAAKIVTAIVASVVLLAAASFVAATIAVYHCWHAALTGRATWSAEAEQLGARLGTHGMAIGVTALALILFGALAFRAARTPAAAQLTVYVAGAGVTAALLAAIDPVAGAVVGTLAAEVPIAVWAACRWLPAELRPACCDFGPAQVTTTPEATK